MSILSTAYKSSAPSSTSGSSTYVAVDSKAYQGNWSGTYPDGKSFSLDVSRVDGFCAQVPYQSGGTSQYQQVLIKDLSFRFGNTKFTPTGDGKAQVKNVVTDAATGSTYLGSAPATRNS